MESILLNHTNDLNHLVPNLKLRIWIGNPQTLTFPAAWEMTLAYPAGKIEVTGAALGRIHLSGGLVSVSTTSSPEGCGGPGSTQISMIDPDKHSLWVDLVYRLRDPSCGRAVVSDFTPVGSSKAYDVDGTLISLAPLLDPNYSF